MKDKAEIGVIGGSGFYEFLKNAEWIDGANRYGNPSSQVALGKLGNKAIAFLQRHGSKHTVPPHKISYKANIEALTGMGVKRIIATGAMGSLVKDYAPGDIVFLDQFVNMTHGRADTFFDEGTVAHIGMAHPYCPELRKIGVKVAKEMGIRYHDEGTIVVINGPRYSTKAESRFFAKQGFHIVNMTQYPEAALAHERALCYLCIGIVTDYDAGLEGEPNIKPVSDAEMIRVFNENVDKVRDLILKIIPEIPEKRSCSCSEALKEAGLSLSS